MSLFRATACSYSSSVNDLWLCGSMDPSRNAIMPTYTSLCPTSARHVSSGPLVRAPNCSMPRTLTSNFVKTSQTARRCWHKSLYVDEMKIVLEAMRPSDDYRLLADGNAASPWVGAPGRHLESE